MKISVQKTHGMTLLTSPGIIWEDGHYNKCERGWIYRVQENVQLL
jgi:hypothetical protein